MTNLPATQQAQEIAPTWTREQVELIKRTVANNATDDELNLFMYTAARTGLDPLLRQIHFVKRNTRDGGKATIQTGIDGYRLLADRTGKYAGNDDPVFDDEEKPRKATVTVYKLVNGVRCPFTATARWDQYFPGDAQGFMWKKMPHLMLGKCAEALALRKAFPAELSGVYTHEEMEQAGPTDTRGFVDVQPPQPAQAGATTGTPFSGIPTAQEETGRAEPRQEPQGGDQTTEPTVNTLMTLAREKGVYLKKFTKERVGTDELGKLSANQRLTIHTALKDYVPERSEQTA